MSKLTKAAIVEMCADLPSPDNSAAAQRALLQMQRRVATQQKCIHDLSRAVTRLQQQLYLLNRQENHV